MALPRRSWGRAAVVPALLALLVLAACTSVGSSETGETTRGVDPEKVLDVVRAVLLAAAAIALIAWGIWAWLNDPTFGDEDP